MSLSLALLCAIASAQTPPRVGGSLGTRGSWAAGFPDGSSTAPALAKSFGTPALSLLTEGNIWLKLAPRDWVDLSADLSLFVNLQSNASGLLGSPPVTKNLVIPSELYASVSPHAHLSLLVGRKRVTWGSGFAWNPSDVLNPPKDPTDPSLQRAGAWMVRAEAPFERFTLTALWAPKVTADDSGLPRRFLTPPGGSGTEQLFAVRGYALVADTDLSVAWTWSDRYSDGLAHSHRFAGSFSRYFFRDYELHLEGIVQRGRDSTLLEPDCLPSPGDPSNALACAAGGRRAVDQPFLYSKALYLNLLAGTRYVFSDESLVSVEYFFHGAGLSREQFDARQRFLDQLPVALEARPSLPPQVAAALPDPSLLTERAEGQPQRFTFQTLRRHYLFLVFQKPKIRDDFTVLLNAIVGLEDPSALVAPGLSWNAREWLVLSAFAYVPVGRRTSEFGSLPFRVRTVLEAKAFY